MAAGWLSRLGESSRRHSLLFADKYTHPSAEELLRFPDFGFFLGGLTCFHLFVGLIFPRTSLCPDSACCLYRIVAEFQRAHIYPCC